VSASAAATRATRAFDPDLALETRPPEGERGAATGVELAALPAREVV